jgi:hypothetical protein
MERGGVAARSWMRPTDGRSGQEGIVMAPGKAPAGKAPAGKASAAKGSEAAKGLLRNARKEERKVEAKTGKPLKKGAARVDERARSSDGKSAGAKQR